MSNQPHATPAQWATLHLVDPFNDAASCILELRARVEALEADASKRQHGEAARRAEPDPAVSLVDRVANAMYKVARDSDTAEARAAIREVAAWLQSECLQRDRIGCGRAWASLIGEEANR